jgi:enterochelin esterase-like enzyme
VIELARRHRGPIIEPDDDTAMRRVTFVFQDTTGDATRAGLLCPAIPDGFALLRPLGDRVFAGGFRIPVDARVGYRFCPDPPLVTGEQTVRALRESPAASRVDRLNPLMDVISIPELNLRTFESVLAMPAAPPAASSNQRPGPAAGTVEELSVPSDLLRGERPVTVYRPAGHADAGGLPLVLLLDAQHTWWRAPALFDGLLAEGAAPPFLGVTVGSRRFSARLRDLAGNPAFAGFVVEELLPLLRSRYGLPDGDHVVAGFSAGALGAAYLALREPRRFPRLVAISGGFHLTKRSSLLGPQPPAGGVPWLVDDYERATSPLPRRAYLAAGRYEAGGELGVAAQTARLGEILRARGTDVRVEITASDHNTISARAHLAAALSWLLT